MRAGGILDTADVVLLVARSRGGRVVQRHGGLVSAHGGFVARARQCAGRFGLLYPDHIGRATVAG